jgi:Flp pilus assembly protein TadG
VRAGKPFFARLRRDASGATAVEFAVIAPALLMVLLGLMELSHNIYTTTLLEGAIQQAGRNSSLEGAGAKSLAIDTKLRSVVDDIVPNATIAISRRAYADYTDVEQPEDFTDSNDDGQCNEGEPFEDVNGNGTWDEDRGRANAGGARDAVLYDVTVTYPRAFPVMGLLGFSKTVTAKARTVLRNQPYGPRNTPAAVGSCE